MKIYAAPTMELNLWTETEDVLTLSWGTSNDNNYSDIEDWGE